MNNNDILHLIKNDIWMMEILKIVKELDLPDWWIGAGFIRSKVWDTLHHYHTRTPLPDIDVIYFDPTDFSESEATQDSIKAEIQYERILQKQKPGLHWSVTNQARMHVFHNDLPYKNSEDALAQWPETATSVGVRLTKDNRLVLIAPWGTDDLVNLILRPTKDGKLFMKRVEKKQWLKKWPKLKIAHYG